MDNFRTMISAPDLRRRIRELAEQIGHRYAATPPCVVVVIEGARTFASHLLRHLSWGVPVHEIRASSYGEGMESSGSVAVAGGAGIPARGQRVLLLEDIVDTGRTVERLRAHFLDQGAEDCTVATLLSKPSRRVVEVELQFVGFEIPDEFVIGFGMDVAGRYRDLDRIAIYEASCAT